MDVRLPDGTTIQGVPDGTSREDLAKKLQANGHTVPKEWMGPKEAPPIVGEKPAPREDTGRIGKVLEPMLEPFAAMASGAVAKPVSEIGGMAAMGKEMLMGGGGDPKGFQEDLQRRLTYEPKTGVGKAVTSAIGLPGELLQKGGGAIKEALAPPATAGPVRSAIGEGAGEAFQQIPAFLAKFLQKPQGQMGPPNLGQEGQAIANVRAEGFKAPPTQVNPSMLNRAVEGYAGKWATEQELAQKNQPKTNAKAREDLGLKADAPLNEQAFNDYRAKEGTAYEKVKANPTKIRMDIEYIDAVNAMDSAFERAAARWPEYFKNDKIAGLKAELLSGSAAPAEIVEFVKKLRQDATRDYRSNTPEGYAMGAARREGALQLENLLERRLKKAGYPELVDDLQAARVKIAKSHDIEAATNEATGNVDARRLAVIGEKRPLSGQLKQIADFARTLPKAAKTPESIGGHPGMNPLDFAGGAIRAAMGEPGGAGKMMGVLGPIMGRPLAAKAATSDWYQNRFVQPPGMKGPTGIPPWVLAMLQASQGQQRPQ